MKHANHLHNHNLDPYTVGIEEELGLRPESQGSDLLAKIESKIQQKQKNEYSDDIGTAWVKMMQSKSSSLS